MSMSRVRLVSLLRTNIQFWRDIGANSYILDTIENGYVIPFHSTPVKCCKNNRSALQHKTFVLEAISDLEKKGLVARCSEKPFIVSPLTVSVQNNGKKRLILDLRLVNKHIWKQSVKFEDLKIALNFVFEDCWMIKYDIHSAYHHISIRESQTGMLGFSWQISGQTVYFKFLVLPFGMSCAPYIYTKLTRPLIRNGAVNVKECSCT